MRPLLTAIILLTSCSFALAESSSLKICRSGDGIGAVSGPPHLVLQFYLAWQTKLWPDWQTSESHAARTQMIRAFDDIKKGEVLFDIRHKNIRDAFDHAERDIRKPNNES